jgi:hypothetical protein
MRKVDQDACTLAIAMARADPDLRTVVETMLKKDEQEAGLFAVAFCHTKNLRLRPTARPLTATAVGRVRSSCVSG